jgi:hypothetical protein
MDKGEEEGSGPLASAAYYSFTDVPDISNPGQTLYNQLWSKGISDN